MMTNVRSRFSTTLWLAGALILAASVVAVFVVGSRDSSSDRPLSALCKPWSDFRSRQRSISNPTESFDRYRQSLDEVKKAAAAQGRTDIVEAAERLWAEPGFDKRERALNAAAATEGGGALAASRPSGIAGTRPPRSRADPWARTRTCSALAGRPPSQEILDRESDRGKAAVTSASIASAIVR